MEVRKIDIIIDNVGYGISLETNKEPQDLIAIMHTALMKDTKSQILELVDDMIKTQDEDSVIEFHAIDVLTELKQKIKDL